MSSLIHHYLTKLEKLISNGAKGAAHDPKGVAHDPKVVELFQKV
jgi:hypothetical protein